MKSLLTQLGALLAVCLLVFAQPGTAYASNDNYSKAELEQMLAPVALYPDTVLTHILIAATYPLEIVQAARWLEQNPGLQGEQAVRAAEQQTWDPSVKALVAFPSLLERLSDDLDWTQQLGEAFLADETALLASIQTLRQKAYENGSLNDNKHVKVERERDIIIIEPARKEVVYVPYYDTRVVYGDWWWPHHPPVYWRTSNVYYTGSPFYWGVSVNVSPWFYFGIFDWHQRHVVVHHHYYHTPPRYYPRRHKHFVDARRWQHDSTHRRGVHYRHAQLNRQYNAGYGYQTQTHEYKGTTPKQQRIVRDDQTRVRETKPVYQRKTAEQVHINRRNNHDQRLHRNDAGTRIVEQRAEATRQIAKSTQQPALPAQRSISTEQLRQRAVQQPARQHTNEHRPVVSRNVTTQPQQARQHSSPAERAVAPQRQSAAHNVHNRPAAHRSTQPVREHRQTVREHHGQGRARSIE